MNKILLSLAVVFLMGFSHPQKTGGKIVRNKMIQNSTNPLEPGFHTPPDSAKPQIWWHWMNGHISREAITRDLESMKQSGLGGFTLFNASEGTPPGPVKYMSDAWWDLIKHTVRESERLGLKMGVQNCAGWSASGGPWVTPAEAMQEVVWTEKQVTGPAHFDGLLEIPKPALGIDRDMTRNPEINKRYYVPREQVSGFYRDIVLLAFRTPKGDQGTKPFRLEDWRAKSGFNKMKDYSPGKQNIPASDIIDYANILDITSYLGNDGRLKWTVPDGDWTLLRLGYQPTGRQNHPAPFEGRGLEINKLSAASVDLHWKNTITKFVQVAGRSTGPTFSSVLIDSYEAGHQNWSASFEKDFRNQRGYDPMRFLPALTGRIVGNVDTTERFLWDFRKTISDLIVCNYYGRFAELCKKNGLTFSCEPYGAYGNTDDFTVAGLVGVPTCEWWALGSSPDYIATAKLASSAAHTYGRTVVGSEAFTGQPSRIFEEHPYNLKAQGDYFFCEGINQFSLHSFAHDPYEKAPGLGLGSYGTRFDRRNTWWPYVHGWFEYLARCQYMLQQGRFVADILYYVGEDSPQTCKVREELTPQPPSGYDYDFCNRETLDRIKIKDGCLELPNGMSYRILVLPPTRHMRLEALRKIEELVIAGATIVGPKPLNIPGLDHRDTEEMQLRKIADRLWGDCDGVSVTKCTCGEGRIYWGSSLTTVLNNLRLTPDFSFKSLIDGKPGDLQSSGNGLKYIHRKTEATDFYFISNQEDQSKITEITFRVKDRLPELWHPDNGKTEIAPEFRTTADGCIAVKLKLDPGGSVFVVFSRPLNKGSGVVAVDKNGRPANVTLRREGNHLFLQTKESGEYLLKMTDGNSYRVNVPDIAASLDLDGPWQVIFPSGWGAPEKIELPRLISWSKHPDPGVKYFSGTATYHIPIEVPAGLLTDGQRLTLDLGDVQVISEVLINGKNLGVLWKSPYATDVTKAMHPGLNHLEIRVANLWVNRLIGDLQYPDDCEWTSNTGSTAKGLGLLKVPDWVINKTQRPSSQRKVFVAWQWPHLEKKELLPSGLLGPVRLISEVETEVK